MEQVPSIETVYQAVETLYNNPNTSEKEKASIWLGELQNSIYAWKLADELLQRQNGINSTYFAAQTMRSKIQKSFYELPPESHASLRDSLLEHLSHINDEKHSVVVTQLSIALADLILQMKSWQRPVSDLIEKLSPNMCWPLLIILTVLPEEINSRLLRLGENRREELRKELANSSNILLEFLKYCLESTNEDNVLRKVILCFTSWININAIPLDNILDNCVILRTFDVLNNHMLSANLHGAATDCVCTLLECVEESDVKNQEVIENQLFSAIVKLEEKYHLSVANEDLEKSSNYCRVFTELGEVFMVKLIRNTNEKHTHFSIKALDLILACVGNHDYEVTEITFNYWYRLSEELYQQRNDYLIGVVRPYIERLLASLCRHAQIEPDQEMLLEDGDDFKAFRLKVYELIKDVIFIVGSNNIFRQMFINLQEPNVTWEKTEAALFVMQAVAKNILPEENEIVPKVIEAILNLAPTTHIAVRYTSVLLLGELCEWIEKHPEVLEPALNFLLFSLQQPTAGLANGAATALQNICTSCRQLMPKHFNVLLQIASEIDNLAITNEAVIGLLRGIAIIIGGMPHYQITIAMKQLCSLQINPLVNILNSNNLEQYKKSTKNDPALWLDRLSSIFRNVKIFDETMEQYNNQPLGLDVVHPCRDVITEVWPVLSQCLDKYQKDIHVIERCCRCIKYAIRCVGKQSNQLIAPLIEQIISLYRLHKHSCFLYLGSILVDEFGDDETCALQLLEMLREFIQPTFDRLQEENGLKNHPDTVDDFFRLCSRFLQRSPSLFLQFTALPSIIQLALTACQLDHRDASESVMKFFQDLVQTGRSHPSSNDFQLRKNLVTNIVSESGAAILVNLLYASVFHLPTYLLTDVAEVFLVLKQWNEDSFTKWLQLAIEQLPMETNQGCITITPQQMIDFHVSVTRSDTSKSMASALTDLARLFR